MTDKTKKIYKVVTAIFVVATLIIALYIILNGIGLQKDLDFGAGAYYYADIPNFEKFVNKDSYHSGLALWAAILLFLVWGFLMWKLWLWVDKRGEDK